MTSREVALLLTILVMVTSATGSWQVKALSARPRRTGTDADARHSLGSAVRRYPPNALHTATPDVPTNISSRDSREVLHTVQLRAKSRQEHAISLLTLLTTPFIYHDREHALRSVRDRLLSMPGATHLRQLLLKKRGRSTRCGFLPFLNKDACSQRVAKPQTRSGSNPGSGGVWPSMYLLGGAVGR